MTIMLMKLIEMFPFHPARPPRKTTESNCGNQNGLVENLVFCISWTLCKLKLAVALRVLDNRPENAAANFYETITAC